jgi:hypothetical protein
VTVAIVGHGSSSPRLQGQLGLRSSERFTLALLIKTHHHCLMPSIEIKPGDRFQFLAEKGFNTDQSNREKVQVALNLNRN